MVLALRCVFWAAAIFKLLLSIPTCNTPCPYICESIENGDIILRLFHVMFQDLTRSCVFSDTHEKFTMNDGFSAVVYKMHVMLACCVMHVLSKQHIGIFWQYFNSLNICNPCKDRHSVIVTV